MSSNNRVWIAASAAALCGVLVGAGVVWFAQQSSVAQLTARVTRAHADTQAALQKADELQTALTAIQATNSQAAAASSSPAAAAPPTPAKPKPASKALRKFSYIKKVDTSGSAPVITADYAQMLSGKAAANAAAAHGDESPPPNDYYIVNDSTLLRKLKVKTGLTVTVTTNDDGTADPTGHVITFAKWASYYAAPDADNASLRESPYWITLKDGVVTHIAEQYLP